MPSFFCFVSKIFYTRPGNLTVFSRNICNNPANYDIIPASFYVISASFAHISASRSISTIIQRTNTPPSQANL